MTAYRDSFETCPRCGTALEDAGAARACPGCGGMMVEEPVLAEMVLEMLPPGDLSLLELAVLERAEPPIACPTCGSAMHETDLHGVYLDRCPKHGVWFDRQELEEALRRVGDPSRRPPAPRTANPAPPSEPAQPPPPPPQLANPVELTFEVTTPDQAPARIVLQQNVIKIGRASSAHVRLHDSRASRVHAIIEVDGDTVTLIDLGSSDGTYVAGRRAAKTRLARSDQIVIGASTIDVSW